MRNTNNDDKNRNKKKQACPCTNRNVNKNAENRFPNVKIETVYISTTGDKTLDKPLAALGGKGVFIKELEMSLLSGETDVAVHSAKDLPTKIADGLEISAVLPRGSYGDVFVTRNNFETKDGFVIGTGSLRRKLLRRKSILMQNSRI